MQRRCESLYEQKLHKSKWKNKIFPEKSLNVTEHFHTMFLLNAWWIECIRVSLDKWILVVLTW